MISTRSNARRYLKFVLFDMDTDDPGVYFMNTETHPGHAAFLDFIGLEWNQDGLITGQIIYHPELVAPDGSPGVYTFYWDSVRVGRREKNEPDGSWVYQSYHFSLVTRSYTVLAASMPLLDDNLAFYIRNSDLPSLQTDLPLYRESRIPLVFDEDIYAETSFLALNPGEGYGLLRIMDPDERPHPRDIVIYEALPNELPRVAGIITTVPQTPLSHVNLRAVQDGIPNAFISDALDKPAIDDLIGGYVRYEVTESGWELRAATPAEVDAHYASSRPAEAQTPQRDLTVTALTPLSQVGFEDWDVFGVKAANVAVLGTLGFPAGTVPAGFAIPFYFYDEFMKAHDFYTRIETMLANEDFQTDFEVQDDRLDDLRDDIKDAETPQWIIDALTAMHATYPEGQSLRYRSSTNNEDLPGFNGAGLYDSKTQDPDETEEDGIDKSLKQVFASLWTFRAFTEREFHRIDHLAAKMGVLVHPNYSDELANGGAVSFDPIYGRDEYYYVNTQLGEDLVTNPEAHSVPEELLLRSLGNYTILATSNLVEPGQLLMSDDQLRQLRAHLEVIHDHFAGLYNPAPDDPFAMEIEFKITSDDILAIKQARPWVFDNARDATPVITTAALILVAENETVVATLQATDEDDRTEDLVWDITGGEDQSQFTLTVDGRLAFTAAKDYEEPDDNDGDGDYEVTVQVSDGFNSAEVEFTVRLQDVDDTDPTVSSLAISSDPGTDRTYAEGEQIRVTVTFSETVEVEGTPQLRLRVGNRPRTAGYLRGTGTAALVFGYEVADGDEDTDGVSIEAGRIALNGGMIKDEAENAGELAHGAVAAQAAHKVDGVRPAFVSAAVDGSSLTLTYGEALDGGSRPASGDFTVAGGDHARTVTQIRVSGSVVTLTLNPAVEHGDTGIRVSYTPDTNPLRDAVGNDARGLSSRSVTNTTGAPNTAPEITSPSSFDVRENQSVARRLAARDTDAGDEVTGWSIVGGADRGRFTIASDTGDLSFRTAPDYEASADVASADPPSEAGGNAYVVTVQVRSGAAARELEAEKTLTISVTDELESPEGPEAPDISGETADSLTVSWSEPENTGPPITDYDVQYREKGTGRFTDGGHEGPGLSLTLSDLKLGTAYEVQVKARNEEGTSDWSDSGEGMTVTPLTLAMASGTDPPVSGSFTVRFSFSEEVTGFTRNEIETEQVAEQDPACRDSQGNAVTCDPVIGALQTVDDRVFSATVTPGTNGVENNYTLRLSVPADTVSSATHGQLNEEAMLEVRVAPAGVTVEISSIGLRASGGNGTVRLSWNSPADNGGSPIIRYEYRYAATGEAWSDWENVGPGTSEVTVGNLINGQEYVFEVRAVNALGKGGAETVQATPERRIARPPRPPAAAEAEVAWCFLPRRRWA